MIKILSETPQARVVDLLLSLVVLLTVTDHFTTLNLATTSEYIFFLITPLGFLRLYLDYRYREKRS